MPVMVRAGAARNRRGGAKSTKNSSKLKRNKSHDGGTTSQEFITPESVGTVRLDPATLLGPMPAHSDCILDMVLCKVNHLCQWTQQRLALTKDTLCFTVVGEENMRDKVLLHEVNPMEMARYTIMSLHQCSLILVFLLLSFPASPIFDSNHF